MVGDAYERSKVDSPCHLTQVFGPPEFRRRRSVLAAQSITALPLGSVLGKPHDVLLALKLPSTRKGSVCGEIPGMYLVRPEG